MPSELAWVTISAGLYDATVTSVSYSYKAVISINIAYRIIDTHGELYTVAEWLTFDAPRSSPRYFDTAQGKGRVSQILKAMGLTLADLGVDWISEIPEKIVGARVGLMIGTRNQYGLQVPYVTDVVAPAN
jgi:hypothetical protein